jgi:uncharacterized protein YhfF
LAKFGNRFHLATIPIYGNKPRDVLGRKLGLLSAEIGKLMVVLDRQGAPKATLKTVELTKRRFDEVDEAFAYDEGEGDRSLRYWREAYAILFAAWKILAGHDALV